MKVKSLLIEDIKIEGRYREDMGDIEALAASIKDKGLLQPVVVGADTLALLAGGRRLAASKLAGLSHVPAVLY